MDYIAAIFTLLIVLCSCITGLFSRAYQDNLSQCLGMVLLGIWCASALDRVIDRGFVRAESLMLYIGMACYAAGTVVKVIRHRKDGRAPAQGV